MHDAGRETSSRHKVYRYVRDGIISRKLRPGDMLYERELAQALGVSRTPVREALQSLQDQLNSKNFYQMNPSFDIGLTREPCDCQGECVQ